MTKELVLYGGGFNPPGLHHRKIGLALVEVFKRMIIKPCGDYNYKDSFKLVTDLDRVELVKLGFDDIPGVEFDFADLESRSFSPLFEVDRIYKELMPDWKVWHAIGGDLVKDGQFGKSPIQLKWINGKQVWANTLFAVITHPGYPVEEIDLPPNSRLVKLDNLYGRSTLIRKKLQLGLPVDDLVSSRVADYIKNRRLYT